MRDHHNIYVRYLPRWAAVSCCYIGFKKTVEGWGLHTKAEFIEVFRAIENACRTGRDIPSEKGKVYETRAFQESRSAILTLLITAASEQGEWARSWKYCIGQVSRELDLLLHKEWLNILQSGYRESAVRGNEDHTPFEPTIIERYIGEPLIGHPGLIDAPIKHILSKDLTDILEQDGIITIRQIIGISLSDRLTIHPATQLRIDLIRSLLGSESLRLGENNPALALVWDPSLVNDEDYAELVCALGDLVRTSGGLGVQRIQSQAYGVPVHSGAPS